MLRRFLHIAYYCFKAAHFENLAKAHAARARPHPRQYPRFVRQISTSQRIVTKSVAASTKRCTCWLFR